MTSSLPILQEAPPPPYEPPEHKPGPLETQLDALWTRARGRVYSLAYWRETLRLLRKFNLRMLNTGEIKIAFPYGQVPDCESCVDICCTGPNAIVSLRLRDVAALVDAGRADHITLDRPVLDKAARRDTTWARREADGSVFHQAFPVLTRDRTGTCMLLDDDRKCGAFPAWPLSCARYPYALDLQAKMVFWAKGCASLTVLPSGEAPPRVRALVRAVVDAYNERVKDIILLHVARKELDELGLLKFLDVEKLR